MSALEQKQDEINVMIKDLKSDLLACARYNAKDVAIKGGYTAILQYRLKDAQAIEELQNEEYKIEEEMQQKMQEQQLKIENEFKRQQEAQQAMEQQHLLTEHKKSKKNKEKEHTKILG